MSARRSPHPPGTVWSLGIYAVVVLALAAALGTLVLFTSSWSPSRDDVLAGLLLAAGFAIARQLAIEVDLRRDSVRVTLTEIPLVVGLALLPGPLVVLTFAAVIVTAGLLRRDALTKLAVNVSVSVVSAATAVLVIDLIERLPTAAPDWLALLVAVSVGHGLGMALLVGGMLLLPGSRRVDATLRLGLNIYVVNVLNAVAGVAAVEMLTAVPWGVALVALVAVVLFIVYRAYYGLLHEQRDLELLNRVSLEVAGAGRSADGDLPSGLPGGSDLTTAMELFRDQLNATRIVLHRRLPDGEFHTVVAGRPLLRTLTAQEITSALRVDPGQDTDGVRRLGGHNHTDAVDARGVSEVLLAPLRGAEQILGVVEVHDRQSRFRGFGEADRRLVGTLASHLTTAMDNRRLLAKLRHDAYHDTLTELRNRLGFREAAAKVLRGGELCAVVVVNLDLLPSVNDALGHVWGDRLVIVAGQRLLAALPSGVITARLEGDTFAVLLVVPDEETALHSAEQLRAALCQPYPVDKVEIESAARVGIALTDVEPTRDVDTLLQHADVALQAARSTGETVRTYARSMGQVFLRRFQLVTQFRPALDSGQVDVHFQPKLALATRQVIGVEALVRWRHPEFGMLDPEEWVAIVEATGLIDALTGFVLDRALEQCRAWRDRGLGLSVAVNLSVRNLADVEFPDRVAAALARHDVPSSLLAFELTESAVMSDPEHALPVLRRLHALGVRIAVDDFGTGYSSLAYLGSLPVDALKID
ncbi:MAG: EAL domain-containing protein, partial [Actinomycetota bacterium]|nr:EAL domain-containing protein [Actinomycetota bacterium]